MKTENVIAYIIVSFSVVVSLIYFVKNIINSFKKDTTSCPNCSSKKTCKGITKKF